MKSIHTFKCRDCSKKKKCKIAGCDKRCPSQCGTCMREARHYQNVDRRIGAR